MKRHLVLAGALLLSSACGGPGPETPADTPTMTPPPASPDLRARLAAVTTWGYQLQNVDLAELRAAPFDLVVIEPYRTPDEQWSRDDIAALKASGRIVLAYLSIGEAEDYRPYWQPAWDADRDGLPDPGAPAWLDKVNPDWEGNYKVHYWNPGWQATITPHLDAIVQTGYDGAYLDIVDAYAYYLEQGRPTAPKEMVDFVAALAERARKGNPEFLMFPQNAAGLLDDLGEDQASIDKYLAHIDGLGAEDTFFYSDTVDQNPPLDPQADVIEQLDRFRAAGKVVVAVDYVTEPKKVKEFYRLAREHGFIPYATVRALDRLSLNPP